MPALGGGARCVPAERGQLPSPARSMGGRGTAASPLTFGAWAAGYVAYAPPGHGFTAVAAEFVLPASPAALAPGAAPAGAWVAIWAGIGLQAKGGSELLQAGVSMHSDGSTWDVVAPWWINEPQQPTPPHPLPLALHPGDRIEVSVQLADPRTNTWVLSVTDASTAQSADAWCYGCASARQSAGWLMEDPSSGSGYTPFADPGQVRFVSAQAALDGGPLSPLNRVDWRPVLREPGPHLTQQGPVAPPASTSGGFVVADLTTGKGAAPVGGTRA